MDFLTEYGSPDDESVRQTAGGFLAAPASHDNEQRPDGGAPLSVAFNSNTSQSVRQTAGGTKIKLRPDPNSTNKRSKQKATHPPSGSNVAMAALPYSGPFPMTSAQPWEAEERRKARERKQAEEQQEAAKRKEEAERQEAWEQKEAAKLQEERERRKAREQQEARKRKQERERRKAQELQEEEERRKAQERQEEEERRKALDQKEAEDLKKARKRRQEEERRKAQERQEEEERRKAQERQEEEERRKAREQQEAEKRQEEEERRKAQEWREEEEQRKAPDLSEKILRLCKYRFDESVRLRNLPSEKMSSNFGFIEEMRSGDAEERVNVKVRKAFAYTIAFLQISERIYVTPLSQDNARPKDFSFKSNWEDLRPYFAPFYLFQRVENINLDRLWHGLGWCLLVGDEQFSYPPYHRLSDKGTFVKIDTLGEEVALVFTKAERESPEWDIIRPITERFLESFPVEFNFNAERLLIARELDAIPQEGPPPSHSPTLLTFMYNHPEHPVLIRQWTENSRKLWAQSASFVSDTQAQRREDHGADYAAKVEAYSQVLRRSVIPGLGVRFVAFILLLEKMESQHLIQIADLDRDPVSFMPKKIRISHRHDYDQCIFEFITPNQIMKAARLIFRATLYERDFFQYLIRWARNTEVWNQYHPDMKGALDGVIDECRTVVKSASRQALRNVKTASLGEYNSRGPYNTPWRAESRAIADASPHNSTTDSKEMLRQKFIARQQGRSLSINAGQDGNGPVGAAFDTRAARAVMATNSGDGGGFPASDDGSYAWQTADRGQTAYLGGKHPLSREMFVAISDKNSYDGFWKEKAAQMEKISVAMNSPYDLYSLIATMNDIEKVFYITLEILIAGELIQANRDGNDKPNWFKVTPKNPLACWEYFNPFFMLFVIREDVENKGLPIALRDSLLRRWCEDLRWGMVGLEENMPNLKIQFGKYYDMEPLRDYQMVVPFPDSFQAGVSFFCSDMSLPFNLGTLRPISGKVHVVQVLEESGKTFEARLREAFGRPIQTDWEGFWGSNPFAVQASSLTDGIQHHDPDAALDPLSVQRQAIAESQIEAKIADDAEAGAPWGWGSLRLPNAGDELDFGVAGASKDDGAAAQIADGEDWTDNLEGELEEEGWPTVADDEPPAVADDDAF
jgi:hypothetical protein